MPNMTIYSNKIKELEENVGFSFINAEEIAQKLQESWNKDATEAKLDYLATYREVFLGVLRKWRDSELSQAYFARSEKLPDFKNCLLETDRTLKLCAMALIPGLREDADVLSNMTFGVMDMPSLKNEFFVARQKYLELKEAKKTAKNRKTDAYVKYQNEWTQTTTRKITELVRDKESLRLMSQDEKVDYALALEFYRNAENLRRPLDSQEKELIDEALQSWKQELGVTNGETLDEFVAGQYFRYAQKWWEQDWLDNQVNEAIAEYNKTLNPAQEEIYLYKEEWGKTIAAKQKEEPKQSVEENVPIEPQQKEEPKQPVEENVSIELDGDDDAIDRLLANEEGVTVDENGYMKTIAKEAEKRKQRNEEEEKKRLVEEREKQKIKERTNPTAEISDDTAEMVGDFFMQEELTQEIKETKEMPNRKERVFLQEKVEKFNQEYSLNINHNKVRTSVEQLSALMVKAREEKQRFLDKNSVVVIENGKETCYDAKDYYKDKIDEANKICTDELNRIEEERQRTEKEHKELLDKIEKQAQLLDKDAYKQLKRDNEKAFKEKQAGFDKAIAKAKTDLKESLSVVKGGIVIEKNGDTEKEYKSSRYYETHETQKEQYAYGQYQQMYTRVYKDACKNIKEKNYPEGKVTDFSHVAKDVDNLFKSAMYLSNVYDNDKNLEIVQKCSFGGLSPERLASFATYIDGDNWTKEQHRDEVWLKQSDKARKLLAEWQQDAKKNKNVKPGDRVKATLETRLMKFNKGEITRKQLLDYMLAGEVHLRMSYPSNLKKGFNLIQYNRAKNAILKCRSALGLTKNEPLRGAMNEEYIRMANSMSKEQIFKSVETRMDYALGFKAEKLAFEKEHKIVQDREVARKVSELESLKAKDKEPMSISDLDERKIILTQEPRVKPIVPVEQKQLALSVN